MGAAFDLRAEARQELVPLELPTHLTLATQRTWLGRMVNEYSSSRVFSALAEQMASAGFADDEVDAVRTFAEEERTHGVLCGRVVESAGGTAIGAFRDEGDLPTHDDVSPREAVLRNLLSVSCLSETIAVALIGAERLEMPESPLRELLTRIWADEVGHARFGWRIVHREVPRLDDAARRRLTAYLRVALRALETHELAHLPASGTAPEGGGALGLCSGADARVLFYETVTNVILPQLEAVGLDAREAWARRHA
ncbi:MAG: ferritin-like domain-containing protein [Polyangiaceae bacterium]